MLRGVSEVEQVTSVLFAASSLAQCQSGGWHRLREERPDERLKSRTIVSFRLRKSCLALKAYCDVLMGRHDKGTPAETWGRKATGLRQFCHDGCATEDLSSPEFDHSPVLRMKNGRPMRHLTLCFCLALVATLFVVAPASAGRRWCARDPIVNLSGHELQVLIAIPDEYVHLVNGPVDVTFKTPAGMTRSVVFTDDGFNGFGEVVSFDDDPKGSVNPRGGFTVNLRVSIPIDETLANAELKTRKIPTQITVIDGGKTTVLHGWNSGSWITTRVNNGA